MRFHNIPSEFFANNRKRFTSLMLPSSVAIFHSNDEMHRNGDQNFPYRQHSNLFYLTGIGQEKSILLLAPDCPNPKLREVLFLLETNEHIAVWNGHKYTMDEARKLSGIENIKWLDTYEATLAEILYHTQNIYFDIDENYRYKMDYTSRNLNLANELKLKYPSHTYQRAFPLLTQLRLIKQAEEIETIKAACNITAKAFDRVLRFVKPDVMEYHIQAEIEHEFRVNQAWEHSYYPIIASGKSACVLHYIDNDKECKDGDLLLLDFGAEYMNYASDLSRTIPVNGKFTQRQKDVYNAVLRTMKQAKAMMLAGTSIDAYHAKVCKLMEQEMILLGLFTQADVNNQNPDKPMFMKYFMHGTSHFMGMDVHDLGLRNIELKPGMLLTNEPGIYIPEEGIGIRIENDILITDKEPIDLMENIPLEIEDIETIMKINK